jgi:hypothetical protein
MLFMQHGIARTCTDISIATQTTVPLRAHSVRRNNDMSSDPISECCNTFRNGLFTYGMFQLFSIQAHNTVDSTVIAGGTLVKWFCCDMRLVQIRNQAALSELTPRCLYRRPSWFPINLANCCIYRLMYPSEITSQLIPLNNNRFNFWNPLPYSVIPVGHCDLPPITNNNSYNKDVSYYVKYSIHVILLKQPV